MKSFDELIPKYDWVGYRYAYANKCACLLAKRLFNCSIEPVYGIMVLNFEETEKKIYSE